MYIHYLSLSELPSQTANAVHVMKMSAAFVGLGHIVTLHAKSGGTEEDLHTLYNTPKNFSIALHKRPPVPKVGAAMYACSVAMSCRLARPVPDLAYGRDPFALLAATWMGMPTVLELHSLPEKPMWIRAIRALLRSRHLLGLVTISRSLRDDLALLFALDSDMIFVASDAADDPYGGCLPSPLPTGKETMRIGYVGSLYKGRGIERIIALAERCPDIEFVIVGGAPHEVEVWHRVSNAGNIRYTGHVPHAELGRYYAGFDAMLAPYERNVAVAGNKGDTGKYMSPLKIFEYMSYGKPIVATKLAVLDEIEQLETFCFSPELENTDQWVQCLHRLADDPALRARMGEQAYSVFLHHFTWKTRARNIMEWLRQRIPGA
jgi:Glycosyltransferase